MLMLSRYRGLSLVYEHSRIVGMDTIHGRVTRKLPPKVIKFKRLGSPVPTTALPMRGSVTGVAYGKLKTEDEAKRLQLPEGLLIAFLLDHPSYGRDFVAVGKQGQPLQRPGAYITPLGEDGPFYSELLNQVIPNKQGLTAHLRSGPYRDALDKKSNESYASLGEFVPAAFHSEGAVQAAKQQEATA